MEGSILKTQLSTSDFEAEASSIQIQLKARMFRIIDGSRMALAALCIVLGISTLGTSAHALSVYQTTHVPAEFHLPLWPEKFDIRPTVALIACSVIIVAFTSLSILASKITVLRRHSWISVTANVTAPMAGFISSMVVTCFFYGVNANNSVDTLQSWACRWQSVAMLQQPHFGTLCKQSEAGIAMTILLAPLQLTILGLTMYQLLLRKQINQESGIITRSSLPALC